jgi:hypothetical protein
MKSGILIFAHNNREIDYVLLAIIAGGLAQKNLDLPVSLVTDRSTLDWAKQSNIYHLIKKIFDQIIEVNKPTTNNQRVIHDGKSSKTVPFTNTNRNSSWDLTPYDNTLVIDSDYLIFSDKLKCFFNINQSVLISESIRDLFDDKRLGYHDRYVSDTGIKLRWATTVLFKKNKESLAFFQLVEYIKNNYIYYSDLFRFDSRQFRNDIAFSIADHILNGFIDGNNLYLPPVLTIQDKDVLIDVDQNKKLKCLISTDYNDNYCLSSIKDLDIHIMNKQSIIRNKEKLLSLL